MEVEIQAVSEWHVAQAWLCWRRSENGEDRQKGGRWGW